MKYYSVNNSVIALNHRLNLFELIKTWHLNDTVKLDLLQIEIFY